MLAFMKCVAESVMEKGVRGLAEFVPGGPYLFDVAADAMKRMKERRKRDEVCDELRQAAQATFEEAKAAAERVAREVVAAGPVEDRLTLELYLSQVPGAVRKSLRRPEDYTGRSVPAGFVLDTADDMARLLPPQMPQFRTGQQLPGRPGWSLLEPLGAGGFGEVWKVEHDFIPGIRAVKFCTDPTAKQRLLTHEGKLIARVMKEGRHLHVVPLVDADLISETPWLAYEFVGGGDLAGKILAWQQLPVAERVAQAIESLRVLAQTTSHFHRLTPPIVHRDLKPANILVGDDGALKITDFGIGGIAAQKAISSSRDGATAYSRAVSMLSGSFTPIYASPQQQRGAAADPRDDIHALGVIGYQMLTGRLDAGPGPRFDRDLRKLSLPDSLIDIIGDCIDTELEHRPADGSVLAARLQVASEGPTSSSVNIEADHERRRQQEQETRLKEEAERLRREQEEADRLRLEKEHREKEEAERQSQEQAEEEARLTVLRKAKAPQTTSKRKDTGDDERDTREGFWFVNVGEVAGRDTRNWDDCREYGFLAAGYGAKYSNAMKRLPLGARVFAYVTGLGYVGYGEVIQPAVMARDFIPDGSVLPLLKIPDVGGNMGHDLDDEDVAEWCVGIRWHMTFDREEAKRFPGAFANQNVVCKLGDQKTIAYLRKEFNVTD